ncbi:MAG: LacI family DNA-binding transcriptional regulator, partial [Oscillospiraceae bacterium]|nr:LacI family DNA-binding transcriptional regulator [Oscillospiraceae bacterium]
MTIKDIAKACGVSVSTVSRVLNERPDVSDENRRRVREYIERSHYIPNNSARDLVRTKADAVGLVVRGVGNPFYTVIIRAVEEEVNAVGLALVMRQIDERADEVRCGAEMEREKRLRGLIFPGGQFNYTAHTIRALTVPFVCCAFANSYGTLRPEEYSSVSIADG